jgi:hypothetical protein
MTISIPDPTPADVEAWLEELPLANSDDCFDAVLAVLRAFNAMPDLSDSVRFDLAEKLRPYVLTLAQRTEDQFIDAPLPYLPRIARHAEIGIDLHRELGSLYGLACPKSRPLALRCHGDSDLCLAAAYRAFQHWGLLLLRTAQLYREADPEFWSELYRVYRLSETHGVQSTPFPDTEHDEPAACRTPLGQFKRILLFALSDTYRFRQRQMQPIFRRLGELADRAEWQTEPAPGGEPRAWFRLDLESDRAPVHIHEPFVPNPSSRLLFTGCLAHKMLDESMEPREGHAEAGAIGMQLLSVHVAKSLQGAEYRRSTRVLLHRKCLLFVGLSELIQALSPSGTPRDNNGGELALPHLESIDWTTPSRFELQPFDGKASSSSQADERALRTEAVIERILMDSWGCVREEIWSAPPAAPDGKVVASSSADNGAEGELVNTGPRGYCILWCDAGHSHIQVGTLIGISEDRRLPYIGVIRWLMHGERGLRFGMELLSPDAEVVELWDGFGAFKGRGLLLPARPLSRPVPELIVPPTGFQAGALLHLAGERTRAAHYLGKVRESTFSFTLFTLLSGAPDPSGSG